MASEHDTSIINAFLALQVIGAVCFVIIVLSACIFPSGKRHLIWFSFSISWIVFGVSYSLLLFAGQQFKRTPARVPCTAQAGLVYAAPFLVWATTLGIVTHLLLNILSALAQSPKKKKYRTVTNALVSLPWMIWIAVLVGILVYAVSHPNEVALSHNGTYCVIQNSTIPKLTAVCATIGSASVLTLEIALGYVLYRNRAIVNIFSQSLTLAIRILIFTILGIGAMSVGFIFTVTHTRGVQFDVAIAALPFVAALTFGSQMDLFRGWLFWKRPTQTAYQDDDSVTVNLTTLGSASSSVPDLNSLQISAPSTRRGSLSGPTASRQQRANDVTSFIRL
jgi:hypothetical protein